MIANLYLIALSQRASWVNCKGRNRSASFHCSLDHFDIRYRRGSDNRADLAAIVIDVVINVLVFRHRTGIANGADGGDIHRNNQIVEGVGSSRRGQISSERIRTGESWPRSTSPARASE